MTAIDADRVRSLLLEQQSDLQRQMEEFDTAGGGAPDFDENFADSGQVAAELGENVTMLNQIRDHLSEIDAALERLDDGTYGVCEICGEAIAVPRLEALPATRYCIDHA